MEKLNTPEAVLAMSEKSQPRRTASGIRTWSVVLFKYTPDKIVVDVYSEGSVDLLSNPESAKKEDYAFSAR